MKLSLPALIVTGTLTHTVLAGGLIEQLPADGTWVKFDMIPTDSSPSFHPGPERETLTMSSVGVLTVDGAKCRWIELKIVPKTDAHQLALVKFLVPEQFLTAKEDPMCHILKLGCLNVGVNTTPGKPDWIDKPDFRKVPYHIFLCGPLTNNVSLPNVTVVTKLGKLDCSVATGRYEYDGNGILSIRGTFENQLHEKAPFGVVSMRVTVHAMQDGVGFDPITWSLKWVDAGTNAKSEMPVPP